MSDLGWPQVQAIFSRPDVGDLVADIDHSGIAHTSIHTLEPYFPSESVIEAISGFPGRFSLSVGIDPYHPDPQARLAGLPERHPVHGLKIHPQLQLVHPGDPRLDRLMGLAERHRLAVTFHTGTFPFRTCGWEDARLLVPLLDA
jgi:predicted TIM-barrel fold metal-dependent hydrolase